MYKLINNIYAMSKYDIFVVFNFIISGKDFLEEREKWVKLNNIDEKFLY